MQRTNHYFESVPQTNFPCFIDKNAGAWLPRGETARESHTRRVSSPLRHLHDVPSHCLSLGLRPHAPAERAPSERVRAVPLFGAGRKGKFGLGGPPPGPATAAPRRERVRRPSVSTRDGGAPPSPSAAPWRSPAAIPPRGLPLPVVPRPPPAVPCPAVDPRHAPPCPTVAPVSWTGGGVTDVRGGRAGSA